MGKLKEAKVGKKAPAKTMKLTDEIVENTHKIWLAGLGAFSKVKENGRDLFDTLVDSGKKLETRTKNQVQKQIDTVKDSVNSRVKGVSDKASDAWDNVEEMFQDRVSRVLDRLGIPTSKEIQALNRKVETLTKNVKELSSSKGRTAKPAVKESSAAKSVA